MYTSLMVMSLTLSAAPAEKLSWNQDYSAARQRGASVQKPLAVFIGKGINGWQKVGRDGALDADLQRFLADNYVCVYIDASTSEGKSLASAFEVPEGLGIILSNRTGDLQAFRHEGDFSRAELDGYLRRFADPNLVVGTTVSNPGPKQQPFAPFCPNCSTCPNGKCPR